MESLKAQSLQKDLDFRKEHFFLSFVLSFSLSFFLKQVSATWCAQRNKVSHIVLSMLGVLNWQLLIHTQRKFYSLVHADRYIYHLLSINICATSHNNLSCKFETQSLQVDHISLMQIKCITLSVIF